MRKFAWFSFCLTLLNILLLTSCNKYLIYYEYLDDNWAWDEVSKTKKCKFEITHFEKEWKKDKEGQFNLRNKYANRISAILKKVGLVGVDTTILFTRLGRPDRLIEIDNEYVRLLYFLNLPCSEAQYLEEKTKTPCWGYVQLYYNKKSRNIEIPFETIPE